MTNPPGPENDDDPPPTGCPWHLNRRALIGLGVVAGVAVVDIGGFGYATGWLRPDALTADRMVDGFEEASGLHPGFRRAHAKGVSAVGTFTSTGAGAEICRATIFAPGIEVPALGRFSIAGAVPDQPDEPDSFRGLGLLLRTPDGQQWRTAMIDMPVFTDATPAGLYERTFAMAPSPSTGKPDPQKSAAFLARHPETAAALKLIKKDTPTTGFADSTFRGLSAFLFTNAAGETVPVRWSMVPDAGNPPPPVPVPPRDKDYQFNALHAELQTKPLRWHLVLTIGDPGDPTHDATKPWPPSRRTVDAGTLTITAVHAETAGNARDVNFDPMVLPDGISASDDPLPRARSAAYASSYRRRAREHKTPSDVQFEGTSA